MLKYDNIEQWLKDFEIFEKNPNDKHLLAALQKRTNNSSDGLRKQVQEFLQNKTLESNPFEVFGRVMKEVGPEFFLMVKNESDPWFKV